MVTVEQPSDSEKKKVIGELWFPGLTLKTLWQAVESL
jgi:hypothetical protein